MDTRLLSNALGGFTTMTRLACNDAVMLVCDHAQSCQEATADFLVYGGAIVLLSALILPLLKLPKVANQ
jgi:hydrogenase-4 membrane subunit HyfE